jgi:hypothetical protein
MRLGLLADVHEAVEHLDRAIAALRDQGISRFVVLGDVFETGQRLAPTVARLADLDGVGVWGNHDFGLCGDVAELLRRRYPAEVLTYFGTLKPWLEVDGCRFQHVEPFLDSTNLDDLWSYGGDGLLDPARSFASCPHRRIFMGHVHRWELRTPEGPVTWDGTAPIRLDAGRRYLVVIHAVQQGWCAWYDTEGDVLCPLRVG